MAYEQKLYMTLQFYPLVKTGHILPWSLFPFLWLRDGGDLNLRGGVHVEDGRSVPIALDYIPLNCYIREK